MSDAATAAPPTPVFTSSPASRQARLNRILILKARLKGLEGMIDTERATLEMEMKQAGDTALKVDGGDSFFRSQRQPRVTNSKRLAEIVPATVLAENFKPTVTFVEGLQKAGLDWNSCIAVDEPEHLRIERARTSAAKEYYQQVSEDTARQAAQRADQIAHSLAQAATNPPPANA